MSENPHHNHMDDNGSKKKISLYRNATNHLLAVIAKKLSVIFVIIAIGAYGGYRLYYHTIPLSWLSVYLSDHISKMLKTTLRLNEAYISYPEFGKNVILRISDITWQQADNRFADVDNVTLTFKASDLS